MTANTDLTTQRATTLTELLLMRHGAEYFALALTAAVEAMERPALAPIPEASCAVSQQGTVTTTATTLNYRCAWLRANACPALDDLEDILIQSDLGLGPAPPATNWGSMLSNGLNYIYEGKWWLIYPAGIAIVLTVVAFNFIGDAMRAALEVRLQER